MLDVLFDQADPYSLGTRLLEANIARSTFLKQKFSGLHEGLRVKATSAQAVTEDLAVTPERHGHPASDRRRQV